MDSIPITDKVILSTNCSGKSGIKYHLELEKLVSCTCPSKQHNHKGVYVSLESASSKFSACTFRIPASKAYDLANYLLTKAGFTVITKKKKE